MDMPYPSGDDKKLWKASLPTTFFSPSEPDASNL